MITVVIVDDFVGLRAILKRVLERTSEFTVVGMAGDGREGVEVARATQPDIVLLDLSMPGMDGLEALPLIKEAAPRAKVVVMSGFTEELLATMALERGAVRYLEKGLPADEIAIALREVAINGTSRHREAPPAPAPGAPARAGSELDVNMVVAGCQPRLKNMVGPRIALAISLGKDLAAVHAEQAAIEQIVIGLVESARAAMPEGGSLMIETARGYASSPPGWYVELRAHDGAVSIGETGRRLNLVRELARNCGGYLSFQADQDRATVAVRLPGAAG